MKTEVMIEGKMYLADDLTIRAYPSRRYIRIGEINFSYAFLTAFDSVGVSFEVVKTDDGIVTVRQLTAGEKVK